MQECLTILPNLHINKSRYGKVCYKFSLDLLFAPHNVPALHILLSQQCLHKVVSPAAVFLLKTLLRYRLPRFPNGTVTDLHTFYYKQKRMTILYVLPPSMAPLCL